LPSATWASIRRERESSKSFGLVDGRRDCEISGPEEILPEYQLDKLLLILLVKDFCARPVVGSSVRVLRTTSGNVRRAYQSAGELEAAQLARAVAAACATGILTDCGILFATRDDALSSCSLSRSGVESGSEPAISGCDANGRASGRRPLWTLPM